MRKIFILVAAASLTACATAPQTQVYRPSGAEAEGPAWTVSGEYNQYTNDLRVLVDGEPAAVGKLWYDDPAGAVRGSYQGHPVRAECAEYRDDFSASLMVLCDVYIDDERAALLTFS